MAARARRILGAIPHLLLTALLSSPASATLPGDCDADGRVTAAEVQMVAEMLLGQRTPGCAADANGDGAISPDELQLAVNAYLAGGPGGGGLVEVGRATIGPSGGTATGGDASLIVPAGAFASTQTIVLLRDGDAPREADDLSDTFAIQGLPDSLAGDLALEITPGRTPPAGTTALIRVDVPVGRTSFGADVSPLPLPATTTGGGRLRITLPKSWVDAPPGASRADVRAALHRLYRDFLPRAKAVAWTRIERPRFFANAATADVAKVAPLLDALESALTRLEQLGFNLACRVPPGGAFRKIELVPRHLGNADTADLGGHNSRLAPCGDGYVFNDFLDLNVDRPLDNVLKATAGHELFHLVQDTYTGALSNVWLKEAASTWFESVLVSGHCPDVQRANYAFPWNGLFNASGSAVEAGSSTKERRHGYGAANVLRYESERSAVLNSPFASTIFTNLKAGSSEHAALSAAVGQSLSAFWTAFAKEYVFAPSGLSCLESTVVSAQEVKDSTSLPQAIEIPAYGFSARSYRIGLTSFSATQAVPLPILLEEARDGQSVTVWDVKLKKELVTLTKDAPRYQVDDLRSLGNTVLLLLFLDVNPPTTSVTNTVRIAFAEALTKISLGTTHMQLLCASGSCLAPGSGEAGYIGKPGDAGNTISGLTWIGPSFELKSGGVRVLWGSVTADFKRLVSFRYDYGGIMDLEVVNVPRVDADSQPPDKHVYRVEGEAARASIVRAVVKSILSDSIFSGVDYTKPVRFELILSR